MKIMKQHIVLPFIAAAAIITCLFFFANKAKPAASSSFSMDTLISYTIWGNNDGIEESNKLVTNLDKQFSMYGDGALSQLNQNTGNAVRTTTDLFDIVEKSNALSSQYGGEVDITSGSLTKLWGISTDTPYLPTKDEALAAVSSIDYEKVLLDSANKTIRLPEGTLIDLGSVAKGYACDKLKELYDNSAKDVPCAIVSMGSSSLLYGTKPDKSPFSIEIKNPDGGEPLGIIKTDETFLSTSGGYERYFEVDGIKFSHIFDIKTGFPAESEITSVTVLCDNGLKSDFLSTLIFIDDSDGLKEHLNASDYKIVVATKDKKVYASSSINFTLNEECGFTMADFK